MHYNLRGEISKANPYGLDRTLTKESMAAEAKAVGDALDAVHESAEAHKNNKENPHGVTKAQVGLDKVDNTADINKPVSTAQANAINAVKTELAGAIGKKVEKAEGKGLSTNDFTNAYKEKLDGIEAGANKYVLLDGSVTKAKLGSDVTAAALGGAAVDSDGKVKPEHIRTRIVIVDEPEHTLEASEVESFIRFGSTLTEAALTIPDDFDNAKFPLGTAIEVSLPNVNGVLTIKTASSDTTMFTPNGNATSVSSSGCYPVFTLIKIFYHKWQVRGDFA